LFALPGEQYSFEGGAIAWHFPQITQRPYQLALAPFGFYWFMLEENESEASQDL